MITRWIISAIATGVVLSACAGRLDVPSGTLTPTTPLPSSSSTPMPPAGQQTPADEPTLSLTLRCTNGTYGFSVSYPTNWFTNHAVEINGTQVAPCTLFAPFAGFEVLSEVTNVPIFLKHEDGSLPSEGAPLTIDGRSAVVVETDVNGEAWHVYYAKISEEIRFAAFAFDNGSAPFEESRAVLDAMMDTVDLDGG